MELFSYCMKSLILFLLTVLCIWSLKFMSPMKWSSTVKPAMQNMLKITTFSQGHLHEGPYLHPNVSKKDIHMCAWVASSLWQHVFSRKHCWYLYLNLFCICIFYRLQVWHDEKEQIIVFSWQIDWIKFIVSCTMPVHFSAFVGGNLRIW